MGKGSEEDFDIFTAYLKNENPDVLIKYIIEGFETTKKFRGDMAEKCLQLDIIIGNIISSYFCKENRELRKEFHENLLNNNFITTYRKIAILSGLNLHKKDIFKGEHSDLIKRLEWFFQARNDLMHLPRDSYHPQLKMRWKNKKENYILDNKFMSEIENEYQYLLRALMIISHEFGLQPLWKED